MRAYRDLIGCGVSAADSSQPTHSRSRSSERCVSACWHVLPHVCAQADAIPGTGAVSSPKVVADWRRPAFVRMRRLPPPDCPILRVGPLLVPASADVPGPPAVSTGLSRRRQVAQRSNNVLLHEWTTPTNIGQPFLRPVARAIHGDRAS
jgi:hypothetical protein